MEYVDKLRSRERLPIEDVLQLLGFERTVGVGMKRGGEGSPSPAQNGSISGISGAFGVMNGRSDALSFAPRIGPLR